MRTGTRRAAALTLCGAVAALALGGCGGPAREGYAAVGAAPSGTGGNVPPRGDVEFQQLGAPPPGGAAPSATSGTSTGARDARTPAASARGGAPSTAPGGSAAPGTSPDPGPAAIPGTPHRTEPPGPPGSTPPPTPGGPGTPAPAPATPARLTLGAPLRSAAADRWCERVTVAFTNTGTTAARSGTVNFATHIIGALGIDWATIATTQPLPAPIAGGTSKTQTYTVCVEAWRVPLGMHVETRNVTATWS
ncbi:MULTISPECIES: hypothetical protein [unclassified Streptomyces]|uniref:hypothetical protein n=1 Tax=unclassified Streptomyces TaxID=2593676 RepID=UPI002E33A719|nr:MULTISPECIES: hypothetical protein [unclassified Streptomyces]WUC65477.1 hypothetical protein OG861_15240 [Streptomyces sp. NBC_00539]